MYAQLKKQKGFSLLELLLVLAVLSVLATVGLAAYQQKMQNFRVEKTALQMQQWLEASIAYRADPANKGEWPHNAQALITQNYMPPGSLSGGPFCTGITPSGCYAVSPYPSASDQKQVLVQTTIMGYDNNPTLGIQLANLIAARLPNATNADPKTGAPSNTVFAYATLPSNMVNQGSNFVSATMVSSDASQIVTPHTCPADTAPHVYYALSTYRVPTTDTSGGLGQQLQSSMTPNADNWQEAQLLTSYSGVRGNNCHLEGDTYVGCISGNYGKMLMIRTCEPITPASPLDPAHSNSIKMKNSYTY